MRKLPWHLPRLSWPACIRDIVSHGKSPEQAKLSRCRPTPETETKPGPVAAPSSGTLQTNSTDDNNPAAFNWVTVSPLKLPVHQATQSHPHCSLWNADGRHGSVTVTVAGRFTKGYLINVFFLLFMHIHQFCEATVMSHKQTHVHTCTPDVLRTWRGVLSVFRVLSLPSRMPF